ncbi:MAG: hypothetical protein EKK48_26235 [Candidatus Melainabacteria bacterium]|nr:MAG: hypothetical protein EKK48_26235 [Candidatus Melainabacteria bacterium]
MNAMAQRDVIDRALVTLTTRAKCAQEAAARIDAKLLELPSHMAVSQEIFELVSLMTAHVSEAMTNLDASFDYTWGIFEFNASAASMPSASRIAVLAFAEQKIEACESMVKKALKMVDGEMDVWGNAIPHGANWGK